MKNYGAFDTYGCLLVNVYADNIDEAEASIRYLYPHLHPCYISVIEPIF